MICRIFGQDLEEQYPKMYFTKVSLLVLGRHLGHASSPVETIIEERHCSLKGLFSLTLLEEDMRDDGSAEGAGGVGGAVLGQCP